jgi:DNA-binding transcriptional ArsR family regulator
LRARAAVLYSLLVFTSLETLFAIIDALAAQTSGHTVLNGLNSTINPIFGYSVPLSAAGWIAVGLVVLQGRVSGNRRSRVKSAFAKMGFGSDVFDLMMGMRGAGSRVSLLQNMESPKHRLELSELTGIDWKEVDRQLSVMERYGLVKVQAQSGTVKLYQVTEQGRLLLKLLEELSDA